MRIPLLIKLAIFVFLFQSCKNSASEKQAESESEIKTEKQDSINYNQESNSTHRVNNADEPSLSEMLWKFATACKEAIKSSTYPENDYDEIVDDAQNGYLHISGDFPTCGCACSTTIGAYKKTNGEYILLKYEEWSCSTSYGLSSNEQLSQVLPEGFGLDIFLPENEKINDTLQTGHFI